jgi:hypothetical protein
VFDTEGLEDPDPHAVPPRPPSDRAPGDDPHAAADPIRMGIARRDLRLFGDPEAGATVLGEVKAGDMLMVVKEAGEWVLAIRSGGDGVLMGWTKRSEIAVR